VLTIIARQVHPVLVAVIGLIAAALTALLFYLARKRKK
jgi:LPXTG-motif cell wall-anchored protein